MNISEFYELSDNWSKLVSREIVINYNLSGLYYKDLADCFIWKEYANIELEKLKLVAIKSFKSFKKEKEITEDFYVEQVLKKENLIHANVEKLILNFPFESFSNSFVHTVEETAISFLCKKFKNSVEVERTIKLWVRQLNSKSVMDFVWDSDIDYESELEGIIDWNLLGEENMEKKEVKNKISTIVQEKWEEVCHEVLLQNQVTFRLFSLSGERSKGAFNSWINDVINEAVEDYEEQLQEQPQLEIEEYIAENYDHDFFQVNFERNLNWEKIQETAISELVDFYANEEQTAGIESSEWQKKLTNFDRDKVRFYGGHLEKAMDLAYQVIPDLED